MGVKQNLPVALTSFPSQLVMSSIFCMVIGRLHIFGETSVLAICPCLNWAVLSLLSCGKPVYLGHWALVLCAVWKRSTLCVVLSLSSSCSSHRVLKCLFGCPGFSCSVWGLGPWPGTDPGHLQWEGGVLATGPPVLTLMKPSFYELCFECQVWELFVQA